MFYYVNGTLAVLETGMAVIDCGGVGYMCIISARTEQKLAANLGKPAKLLTYLSVREDAMELFGFFDKEELSMFKLLISVSGVGARTALAILGSVSPEKFAYAVSVGDVKAIKAPGVGPKIAARIILELKDKLSLRTSVGQDTSSTTATFAAPNSSKYNEAIDALVVLGFNRGIAADALKTVDTANLEIEDIIREALKKLMK